MENMRYHVLIVLFLICGFQSKRSYSQRPSDIGVIASTNNLNRLILEYRKPFGENHRLKISASYGENSYKEHGSRIVKVNDSLLTERVTSNSISAVTLRIGVERQIMTSMFSYGADLLVGYRSSIRSRQNNYTPLNFAGTGGSPGYYPYPYPQSFDPKQSRFTRHFIIPGLQWHLSMDVPLGGKEQFFLNIRFAAQLGIERHLKDTDILDPLNEYVDFDLIPELTLFNGHSRLGIGLKYKIGKNNTEMGQGIQL